MGDLALGIAGSALDAQQAVMDTISQNLANSSTTGYVSESANLSTLAGGDALGAGGGVQVSSVSQASDGLLQTNVQQTSGALAQSTALQQVLTGAQSVFPEPGSNGLSAQLSSFWQAWDGIVQDPSASAPRAQVVDLAQNMATTLNQADGQITQLQTNAQSQLGSVVGATNTLLSQVAGLNSQIVAAKGSGADANALIDQQNTLLNTLATDIGSVSRPAADGSVTVSVGGIMLELDAVANTLASTVNSQLAAGYTATGASGSADPLFTGSGAAGLTVNAAVAANPQLIAASATSTLPDATNDAGNAQAMANLYDVSGGPDQTYQAFIQGIGTQVQNVNNQVQAQTSVSNAAQANLQAVVGVDSNTQMVQMLATQQAFQASAQLISTVSSMMQSLLTAV
jgi:flagellar hook-associated protein 1